jgi:hypothetical protein
MRFPSLLCALSLLAACATATPAAGPAVAALPQVVAEAPPLAPSRALRLLQAAGHDSAAPTQADVVATFGAPDLVRNEGAGAALTYRLESCALLLLFEADAQNTQRLTMVHPGSRRAGAAAPSIEQCAAEARPR